MAGTDSLDNSALPASAVANSIVQEMPEGEPKKTGATKLAESLKSLDPEHLKQLSEALKGDAFKAAHSTEEKLNAFGKALQALPDDEKTHELRTRLSNSAGFFPSDSSAHGLLASAVAATPSPAAETTAVAPATSASTTVASTQKPTEVASAPSQSTEANHILRDLGIPQKDQGAGIISMLAEMGPAGFSSFHDTIEAKWKAAGGRDPLSGDVRNQAILDASEAAIKAAKAAGTSEDESQFAIGAALRSVDPNIAPKTAEMADALGVQTPENRERVRGSFAVLGDNSLAASYGVIHKLYEDNGHKELPVGDRASALQKAFDAANEAAKKDPQSQKPGEIDEQLKAHGEVLSFLQETVKKESDASSASPQTGTPVVAPGAELKDTLRDLGLTDRERESGVVPYLGGLDNNELVTFHKTALASLNAAGITEAHPGPDRDKAIQAGKDAVQLIGANTVDGDTQLGPNAAKAGLSIDHAVQALKVSDRTAEMADMLEVKDPKDREDVRRNLSLLDEKSLTAAYGVIKDAHDANKGVPLTAEQRKTVLAEASEKAIHSGDTVSNDDRADKNSVQVPGPHADETRLLMDGVVRAAGEKSATAPGTTTPAAELTNIAKYLGASDSDRKGGFDSNLLAMGQPALDRFHGSLTESYNNAGGKDPLTGDNRSAAIAKATEAAKQETGKDPDHAADKIEANVTSAFTALDRSSKTADMVNWLSYPPEQQEAVRSKLAAQKPAVFDKLYESTKGSFEANDHKPLTGQKRTDAINKAADAVAHLGDVTAETANGTKDRLVRDDPHGAQNREDAKNAFTPPANEDGSSAKNKHAAAPRDHAGNKVPTSSTKLSPADLEYHSAGLSLPSRLDYTTHLTVHKGAIAFDLNVSADPGNKGTVFKITGAPGVAYEGGESGAVRYMTDHLGLTADQANRRLNGNIEDKVHGRAAVADHLNAKMLEGSTADRVAAAAAAAAVAKGQPTAAPPTHAAAQSQAQAAAPAVPDYGPVNGQPHYVDGSGVTAVGPYAGLAQGGPSYGVGDGYNVYGHGGPHHVVGRGMALIGLKAAAHVEAGVGNHSVDAGVHAAIPSGQRPSGFKPR